MPIPYDLTTMRLAVLAYRYRRQAGDSDYPARLAAVAAFREMYPKATEDESQWAVSRIIANVADQHGEWFTYMLAWDSRADREKRWPEFLADPEWIATAAATEKDGQLVQDISNELLMPTAFSSVP